MSNEDLRGRRPVVWRGQRHPGIRTICCLWFSRARIGVRAAFSAARFLVFGILFALTSERQHRVGCRRFSPGPCNPTKLRHIVTFLAQLATIGRAVAPSFRRGPFFSRVDVASGDADLVTSRSYYRYALLFFERDVAAEQSFAFCTYRGRRPCDQTGPGFDSREAGNQSSFVGG